MAQLVLPIFPKGTTSISLSLAFEKRDKIIYYFHGCIPIFSHPEDDIKSFRMFTSQLIANGNCRQVDIIKAFGVPPISVKRAVKLYREKGTAGFYQKEKRIRQGRVLKPDVLSEAQKLLDDGLSSSEVANKLKIKNNTLKKAVYDGRLLERSSEKKRVKASVV